MSFEKRSLINNMAATKKAIIATSPSNPSVGNKVTSKSGVNVSKGLSKSLSKGLSKNLSKTMSKSMSKTMSKSTR